MKATTINSNATAQTAFGIPLPQPKKYIRVAEQPAHVKSLVRIAKAIRQIDWLTTETLAEVFESEISKIKQGR